MHLWSVLWHRDKHELAHVAHLRLCTSALSSFFPVLPHCGGMSLCALSACTHVEVVTSSWLKFDEKHHPLSEVNKDHLLRQARSEFVRQERQVGSLNNCISELQQQVCAQRLELQDAPHGYIESRREQVRLQEELVMKVVLRDTQIRSMHEMGEMKSAQELRVDEVSAQRLRESHDTI